MEKEFWKSKTFWGGALGILGTVGFLLRGDIDVSQAVVQILGFWTAIGFRSALK